METKAQEIYQIVLEGEIDPSWSEWFGGFSIQPSVGRDQTSVSILSGPVHDQAALRGILIKAWDLNLKLVSVNRVQDDLPNESTPGGFAFAQDSSD